MHWEVDAVIITQPWQQTGLRDSKLVAGGNADSWIQFHFTVWWENTHFDKFSQTSKQCDDRTRCQTRSVKQSQGVCHCWRFSPRFHHQEVRCGLHAWSVLDPVRSPHLCLSFPSLQRHAPSPPSLGEPLTQETSCAHGPIVCHLSS